MFQHNWKIPTDIKEHAREYFEEIFFQQSIGILQKSNIAISFKKGNFESFLIITAIIRGNIEHETKLVFKNRLKNTSEGPLSSHCNCKSWNLQRHCPHVLSLFIYHKFQEKNEKGQRLNSVPITNDSLNFNRFAVRPERFGTIISSPAKLKGAANNATYSSLNYLLINQKVIPFPSPKNLNGKIIISFAKKEHFLPGVGSPFETLFKYLDHDSNIIKEVSLLENLYLFNWINGTVFYLPNEIKDFVRKIKINIKHLTINRLVRLVTNQKINQYIDIEFNDLLMEQITPIKAHPEVILNPQKNKKENYINVDFIFRSPEGIITPLPPFFKEFNYTTGLLNSFNRKSDAYAFIENLCSGIADHNDLYKKKLSSCDKKLDWIEIIEYLKNNLETYFIDENNDALLKIESELLLTLVDSLYQSFGETSFRSPEVSSGSNKITFSITKNNLLQGLVQFKEILNTYNVPIYYENKILKSWEASIKFERKDHSINWFDLEFEVSSTDLEIIQNADLINGISLTANGPVILSLDQKNLLRFMTKYLQYESKTNKNQNLTKNNKTILIPFSKARLFELVELKKLGVQGMLTPEEEKIIESLSNFKNLPNYPMSEKLSNILRPYQKIGYRWLRFLYEHKLGACLADDMGLGKTIQVITFLESIMSDTKKVLIVCPVSILLNWENEFKKFSTLRPTIYHGGNRRLSENDNIILTSYGVIKKEIHTTLSNIDFDILIMDEVQNLKNIRSIGAFSARKINALFKICLTGTPVENDLAEFYNIIDLAVPGIWGDLQLIRTISNKKSRLIAKNTAKPFILRRTKSQVLYDLPPKVENDVLLTLSENEQVFYHGLLGQIRQRIETTTSLNKYGEILKGLLRLRQSCLWQAKDKTNIQSFLNLKAPQHIESTKIYFLMEQLEQILDENHQALVFSQFTTYLDIIQNFITEKNWKFSRIDGSLSTKKRQVEIDKFQNHESPIFLISLRAGGLGLNLTAASYVFIMDPWWNPAVESQAIDRAHRIGQKNNLNVYRPIIKGSVEEKILKLQNEKNNYLTNFLKMMTRKYIQGDLL